MCIRAMKMRNTRVKSRLVSYFCYLRCAVSTLIIGQSFCIQKNEIEECCSIPVPNGLGKVLGVIIVYNKV